MTDFTQSQQATAATPSMEKAAVTSPLEQEHSQAAPVFSFDDAPLFEADGPNDVHDDFFSSPEWTELTDPSPALTTSMSFNLESCDTSPLLTDNYEAPDFSGVPLFGDYNSHALYSSTEFSGSPRRSPQNAFNRGKDVTGEESAMLLLRALSHQSNVGLNAKDEKTQDPSALTASPSVISSPLPKKKDLARPQLFSSFSTSSLTVQDKRTDQPQSSLRGIKRRLDPSELLPLDAPIQPRTYKTPSATSRKESESSFADEEAAIAAEKDPIVAKRLSNTLAARRSRHRKAEERQNMLDQIEDEASEKEMWKRRCFRAEEELKRVEEELKRARSQGYF